MPAVAGAAASTWAERRTRAAELRAKHPFAGEVLRLYTALIDAWEASVPAEGGQGWGARREAELIAHATGEVLPRVIEATVAAGPPLLADAVRTFAGGAGSEALVSAWAEGRDQSPIERYLGRASFAPLLESRAPAAGHAVDERHCPGCGGRPQLSWYAPSGEALVSGRRHLQCSRCATSWTYPRLACAACGERAGPKLVVFSEQAGFAAAEGGVVRGLPASQPLPPPTPAQLPQLRIEACESCHRYLIGVDLGRDGRAVPAVDELAALPLDLYAREHGYTKVVPNLMGM